MWKCLALLWLNASRPVPRRKKIGMTAGVGLRRYKRLGGRQISLFLFFLRATTCQLPLFFEEIIVTDSASHILSRYCGILDSAKCLATITNK
jgi:hypothetical protein